MGQGLFITGTDTGCGKTTISLSLIKKLQSDGNSVLGMKPVATGGIRKDQDAELRNPDAWQLLTNGTIPMPYALVNPYVFADPTAPHLAAATTGIEIRLEVIQQAYRTLNQHADWVIIEGIGGWRVPLGTNLYLSEIPIFLKIPVLLIIGLRLGCLNHAILTAESIQAKGAVLKGWIATLIDPTLCDRDGYLNTLKQLIPAPCLGIIPWFNCFDPLQSGNLINLKQ